ncbi:MAG: hypothetical protein ACXW3N_12865 [Rhodoplanes sp.]
MPIIIILLLAILVAQIGYWDTFTAVLGAIGVVILLILLAGAIVFLTAVYFMRRGRALLNSRRSPSVDCSVFL